jgi:hypothetical protein
MRSTTQSNQGLKSTHQPPSESRAASVLYVAAHVDLLVHFHVFNLTCDAVQHLSVSQFPCARTCDAVQGLSVSQFPVVFTPFTEVCCFTLKMVRQAQSHVRIRCSDTFASVSDAIRRSWEPNSLISSKLGFWQC